MQNHRIAAARRHWDMHEYDVLFIVGLTRKPVECNGERYRERGKEREGGRERDVKREKQQQRIHYRKSEKNICSYKAISFPWNASMFVIVLRMRDESLT